jgi:DNA-binding protein H-NS
MANDFEALTTDELYLLHLEVAAVLRRKLAAEKNALEERLRQLRPPQSRRPNPSVKAGLNPDQPPEGWSGRRKRPGKSRK